MRGASRLPSPISDLPPGPRRAKTDRVSQDSSSGFNQQPTQGSSPLHRIASHRTHSPHPVDGQNGSSLTLHRAPCTAQHITGKSLAHEVPGQKRKVFNSLVRNKSVRRARLSHQPAGGGQQAHQKGQGPSFKGNGGNALLTSGRWGTAHTPRHPADCWLITAYTMVYIRPAPGPERLICPHVNMSRGETRYIHTSFRSWLSLADQDRVCPEATIV